MNYSYADEIRELKAQVLALTEARDKLQQEIALAWFQIEHGWDIEPRAYFEKEAPLNGFKSALAQAVHHMWKRRVLEDAPEHLKVDAAASWQPISTMPTEGPVLVYWPQSITGKAETDIVGGKREYDEIIAFGEPLATAWLPLPAPPAAARPEEPT